MSLLLSSQFWPMLSMSRGVINCAKLFLSHRFSRIKSFYQWAVDRDPFLTSTTSAKIGKTAIYQGLQAYPFHKSVCVFGMIHGSVRVCRAREVRFKRTFQTEKYKRTCPRTF